MYLSVAELVRDVDRLWSNCSLFNPVGSVEVKAAAKLSEKWSAGLAKLIAQNERLLAFPPKTSSPSVKHTKNTKRATTGALSLHKRKYKQCRSFHTEDGNGTEDWDIGDDYDDYDDKDGDDDASSDSKPKAQKRAKYSTDASKESDPSVSSATASMSSGPPVFAGFTSSLGVTPTAEDIHSSCQNLRATSNRLYFPPPSSSTAPLSAVAAAAAPASTVIRIQQSSAHLAAPSDFLRGMHSSHRPHFLTGSLLRTRFGT